MEKSKVSAKKVLKIILDVFVWIFVVFAVIVTMLAFAAQANENKIPTIGGKCLFFVETASMEPTINVGDAIVCQAITPGGEEARSLKVDDIVTFLDVYDINGINGDTDFITHRIVEVKKDGNDVVYITKGDNKAATRDTNPLVPAYVYAKYDGIRVPYIGTVLRFMQQPTGFLVCIVLPLVLFFLYELFMFIKKYLEIKNDGKKTITAADEELIRQQAVAEYLRQQQENQGTEPEAPVAEESVEKPAPSDEE